MSSDTQAQFCRLPEVARRTGFSKSTIYQRSKDDPSFPKPIKIGARMTAWRLDEITAWIEARTLAARDGAA